MGILQCVETLSGRPVEFKPDSSLTLRATQQLVVDDNYPGRSPVVAGNDFGCLLG